jgi:divalent metal cation (Fe/Co/Zn/Cd) transporter
MNTTTDLRRWSRSLLIATIAWNSVEAVVAVGAGVAASSIALVGFGFDSLIEVFAAGVVLWQLKGLSEDRERRALRLIGLSFFVLAAYISIEAVRDLIAGQHASESTVGIVLAAVSLVVMPSLGIAKRRVGQRLGSATVVAESAQTMLCSYLSAVLLAGLLLDGILGWWWADPAAGLVIAALALREGREAWNGDPCCPTS